MHFTANTGRTRNYRPYDDSGRIESRSQRLEVFNFRVAECSRTEVTFSLPCGKTEKLSERIRPLVCAIFEFDKNSIEGNYVNFHVSRARVPDMLTAAELVELEGLGAVPAPVMRRIDVVGHPFSSLEVADYSKVYQVVDWPYCNSYLSHQDAQNCIAQTEILCTTAL